MEQFAGQIEIAQYGMGKEFGFCMNKWQERFPCFCCFSIGSHSYTLCHMNALFCLTQFSPRGQFARKQQRRRG